MKPRNINLKDRWMLLYRPAECPKRSTTDSEGCPHFRPLSGVKRKSISGDWRSAFSQNRTSYCRKGEMQKNVTIVHSENV
jgi:hypothetical protein